ncbi:LysR family transcriptional regulator [Derxia gummosa]|uniref:LysR family transcriptional regulator n=1 Tax=Derxia gummosa DSM 723 TaxID=1121388 RepID=A0A8B6XCB9_9BURK|nr:LysR family transcriptional regulator [Derxia gummosa]
MNKRPDLGDLEIFCVVARLSSFNAAAAELGSSPAHVSKRIAILEATLGARLFHRTTRRVAISADGELVYERARRLLDDADGMAGALSSGRDEPAGLLRVSSGIRLGRNHVSHILVRMRERYPKLEVWLELVNQPYDMLAEGIDIDIRAAAVQEPHLVAHRVVGSRRVLCATPGYLARRGRPRTLAELRQHDCLLFRDRGHSFGTWRLHDADGPVEPVKVTGPLGSNHSDIVQNWLLDGQGIAMLSVWDVAEPLADGRVEQVLPQYWEPADVMAVTTARASASTNVRLGLDFLMRELREGPFALRTGMT